MDRNDLQAGACCGGAVTAAEPVARLLNTEMWDPIKQVLTTAAFPREALQKPVSPNNNCGQRDGESLIRCEAMAASDLIELSQAQFAGKAKGSAGAATALASDLRSIREPIAQGDQLFFLYEDPLEALPEHAVIRYTDVKERKPFFNIARNRLLSQFSSV